MENLSLKFGQVTELLVVLDLRVSSLIGEGLTFSKPISVTVSFRDAELTFSQIVSWSYVLVIENAQLSIDFLKKKRYARLSLPSERVFDISKTIVAFRTVMQHNLDSESSKSARDKISSIESWYFRLLDRTQPKSFEDWLICADEILSQIIEMLTICRDELELILQSEYTDVIASEWVRLLERDYQPHEFACVAEIVLGNLGLLPFIDPFQFTKLHFANWKRNILIAPDGFVFNEVATRQIESSILLHEYMPITGGDIIKELKIEPGPEVKRLMTIAKELFYDRPCSKEDLLAKLVGM